MEWKDVQKEIKTITEPRKESITLLADIASLRIDAGLSQRDLAEQTGLKQSAIARFESGTDNPSMKTVMSIVHALGYKLVLEPKAEKKKSEVDWELFDLWGKIEGYDTDRLLGVQFTRVVKEFKNEAKQNSFNYRRALGRQARIKAEREDEE